MKDRIDIRDVKGVLNIQGFSTSACRIHTTLWCLRYPEEGGQPTISVYEAQDNRIVEHKLLWCHRMWMWLCKRKGYEQAIQVSVQDEHYRVVIFDTDRPAPNRCMDFNREYQMTPPPESRDE